MDPTAWFNPFGLFLMAAILVPNFLFARRYPEAFTAPGISCWKHWSRLDALAL